MEFLVQMAQGIDLLLDLARLAADRLHGEA
jgi:hypothetical protein